MAEPPQAGDVLFQTLCQQIVKVQDSQCFQPGLIGLVQVVVQARVLQRGAVLHPGDGLEQRLSAALAAGIPQNLLRDGQRLPGADEMHVPQQVQADGVEGADGHGGRRPLAAQMLFQPGPHLRGRLVGEGDGGDLPGADAPLLHQPGDPGRQRFRLAGAGACRYHSHRGGGGDRLQLAGVQLLRPGGVRSRLRCRGGLLQLPAGLCFSRRQVQAEQGDLPAEPGDLAGGQQGDDAVLPVKARPPLHLPGAQAANALRHAGAGGPGDVFDGHLPQDGELRPQLPEHLLVQGIGGLSGG